MSQEDGAKPANPRRDERPRVRKRRRRRLALVVLLLLVLGLFSVYRYYTQPHKVAQFAANSLSRVLGADVTVSDARFELAGRVTLRGLSMRVPEVEGDAGKLAHIVQADIAFDPWALLLGEFHIEEVSLDNPTLYVCEDVANDRFNFELLQKQHQEDPQAPRTPELPQVFVEKGAVVFGEVGELPYEPIGRLLFAGKLTEYANEPGTYFFMLRQLSEQAGPTPTLSGKLNLEHLGVEAQVDGFALDGPQRNMLPRDFRRQWDALSPSGRMPSLLFNYDAEEGFSAEVSVRDVALTLPFAKARSRLENVSGRFKFARRPGGDLSVMWDDVRGRLSDPSGQAAYVINGTASGSDLNGPFEADIEVTGNMQHAPSVLAALPKDVQDQFWQYAPHGRFEVRVQLIRAQAGGEIKYSGKVDLHDATILYTGFPYQLLDARAEFRFDETLVEVVRIDAVGPNGGKIRVTGEIHDPGKRGSEVKMHITATDAPIDRNLFNAVTPTQRKVLAMFFDEPAYRRLVRDGLIPDEPGTRLGGRGSLDIRVHRLPGPERIWRTTVVATAASPINMLFKHWPYPFTATTGRLIISDTEVRAENVVLQGPHGGKATLTGRYFKDVENDGVWRPDLKLEAVGLPMDELLLSTVKPPQDQWLRRMQITGKLNATARVFDDGVDRHAYHVDVTMEDGRSRPHGGDYVLEGLKAKVALRAGRATIERLTAQHGDTTLSITGNVGWVGGKSDVALNIEGRDVRFEDPIVQLIPNEESIREQLAEVFDRFKPTGGFDFDLALKQGSTNDYTLRVAPRTLAFDLNQQRLELKDMSGSVTLTAGRIVFDNLMASWPDGRGAVTGTVNTSGDTPIVDVKIDADVTKFGKTLRTVLPTGVTGTIEKLQLGGRYAFDDAHLTYKPNAEGKAEFGFTGDMLLTDAKANAGVTLTEINGVLSVTATHTEGNDWPRIDLSLKADRLRVIDRMVAPLSMTLSNKAKRDRLVCDDLRGAVYGGVIVGDGMLWFDDDPGYRINVVLQDAALAPMLDPLKQPADDVKQETTKAPQGKTATLSASLSLQGPVDDPAGRVGRGEARVKHADLYRTPLSLALLQVINLTWPSAKSFDRAAASYIIDGDNIRFDTVRFDSPSVEVIGKGTMKYSTQALDLRLVSRNPNTDWGAVGDLLNLFKDQIISIRVTGTLGNPKTEAESLEGFKKTIRDIFGTPKPDDAQPRRRPNPAPVSGTPTRSGQ